MALLSVATAGLSKAAGLAAERAVLRGARDMGRALRLESRVARGVQVFADSIALVIGGVSLRPQDLALVSAVEMC